MKSKNQKKSGKPEQQASAPALPAKPAHTIELHPTDAPGVFTAKINGKRAVVALTARDRASADKALISVTIPPTRLKAASTAGNKESLPIMIAVAVTVKGKWSSGWVLPFALYQKQAQCQTDFALTASARLAYAADKNALTAVKFVIAPAPKKAA